MKKGRSQQTGLFCFTSFGKRLAVVEGAPPLALYQQVLDILHLNKTGTVTLLIEHLALGIGNLDVLVAGPDNGSVVAAPSIENSGVLAAPGSVDKLIVSSTAPSNGAVAAGTTVLANHIVSATTACHLNIRTPPTALHNVIASTPTASYLNIGPTPTALANQVVAGTASSLLEVVTRTAVLANQVVPSAATSHLGVVAVAATLNECVGMPSSEGTLEVGARSTMLSNEVAPGSSEGALEIGAPPSELAEDVGTLKSGGPGVEAVMSRGEAEATARGAAARRRCHDDVVDAGQRTPEGLDARTGCGGSRACKRGRPEYGQVVLNVNIHRSAPIGWFS